MGGVGSLKWPGDRGQETERPLTETHVKSRITLRETWSRRQAGAMRPVRRAGWVWAASCAPAVKKTARARCTCAGAAHKHSSLIPGGFLVPVSPAQRGEGAARGSAILGLGKGALCLSFSLSKPLQRWCTVYITNRDMNPDCVGTVHCYKAPLWGRRLDLGSLNITPRFAYRFLLLL